MWSGWCARGPLPRNSMFFFCGVFLRVLTCVDVAFAFCVAGVEGCQLACCFLVQAQPVVWCILQFCGRRWILWRGAVLMNRGGRGAQAWQSRGRGSILWVAWRKMAEASLGSLLESKNMSICSFHLRKSLWLKGKSIWSHLVHLKGPSFVFNPDNICPPTSLVLHKTGTLNTRQKVLLFAA